MEQRKAARAVRAAQLDAQIAEQRAAITKMERELEASGQVFGINLFPSGPVQRWLFYNLRGETTLVTIASRSATLFDSSFFAIFYITFENFHAPHKHPLPLWQNLCKITTPKPAVMLHSVLDRNSISNYVYTMKPRCE